MDLHIELDSKHNEHSDEDHPASMHNHQSSRGDITGDEIEEPDMLLPLPMRRSPSSIQQENNPFDEVDEFIEEDIPELDPLSLRRQNAIEPVYVSD